MRVQRLKDLIRKVAMSYIAVFPPLCINGMIQWGDMLLTRVKDKSLYQKLLDLWMSFTQKEDTSGLEDRI